MRLKKNQNFLTERHLQSKKTNLSMVNARAVSAAPTELTPAHPTEEKA